MASIGHIAIGMAAARWLRGRLRPDSERPFQEGVTLPAFMLFWAGLSLLPDADVIGFSWGVRYAAEWGHRGATHSVVFGLIVGLLVGACAPLLRGPRLRTAVLAAAVVVSHPLLDVMTTGGLGCALFWPFDLTRYFAPWRPIPVAPIGSAFFSARGLVVALTELVLFLPFLLYGLWPRRPSAAPTARID